jgi:hypothetical protein
VKIQYVDAMARGIFRYWAWVRDTLVVLSCDFNEWVFMILAYSGMVVY